MLAAGGGGAGRVGMHSAAGLCGPNTTSVVGGFADEVVDGGGGRRGGGCFTCGDVFADVLLFLAGADSVRSGGFRFPGDRGLVVPPPGLSMVRSPVSERVVLSKKGPLMSSLRKLGPRLISAPACGVGGLGGGVAGVATGRGGLVATGGAGGGGAG